MADRTPKRSADGSIHDAKPSKVTKNDRPPVIDFKRLLAAKIAEKRGGTPVSATSIIAASTVSTPAPVPHGSAGLPTRQLSDSDDDEDTMTAKTRSVPIPVFKPPDQLTAPHTVKRKPTQPPTRPIQQAQATQRRPAVSYDTTGRRATTHDEITDAFGELDSELRRLAALTPVPGGWPESTRGERNQMVNPVGVKELPIVVQNITNRAIQIENRLEAQFHGATEMVKTVVPTVSVRGGVFTRHVMTDTKRQPFLIEACEFIPSMIQEAPIPFRATPSKPFAAGTKLLTPKAGAPAVDLRTAPVLGKGYFGTVYKVGNLACKVQHGRVMPGVSNAISDVVEESLLGSRLRHPNIITFVKGFLYHGAVNTEAVCVSLWELGLMDLLSFTQQSFWQPGKDACDPLVKRYLARRFEKHTLLGLEHLHERGLMHRDIKSQNIFIFTNGGRLVAKLGDLGCCSKGAFCDAGGTRAYFPPETLAINVQCCASDMWAWGVTMWEVHTGRTPFWGGTDVSMQKVFKYTGGFDNRAYNQLAVARHAMAAADSAVKPVPDLEGLVERGKVSLSPSFTDIMKSVLRLNPNDRATASDLLKSPRYADESLMEGCECVDRKSLEKDAPEMIRLLEHNHLPPQKVIMTTDPHERDQLAEKVRWGQVPMEVTRDFRPAPLYMPWLARADTGADHTAKKLITLTPRDLVSVYPVVATKEYGVREIRVYRPPEFSPTYDIVYLELKPTIDFKALQSLMEGIQAIQKSIPYVVPVFHYTLGAHGTKRYMIYVTPAKRSITELNFDGETDDGTLLGAVVLKQLVSLAVAFRDNGIDFTTNMYNTHILYHDPRGVDIGPLKLDMVIYMLLHQTNNLNVYKLNSTDRALRDPGDPVLKNCLAAYAYVKLLMSAPRALERLVPKTVVSACKRFEDFFMIPAVKKISIPPDTKIKVPKLFSFIKIEPPQDIAEGTVYASGTLS
ncbi:ORF73 [Ictalurid herpesvirus 1]|nr:ORF73 [Ictalurid herpesvirus 1]